MNKTKNKKVENTKDNNLNKLYPFNGRSQFLIDKFYIIGYNYLTLHRLLINNLPKSLEEDNEKETKEPHKFNIEEFPNILNEITSDFKKEGLPNETILQMIYPKKIDFYYTSEECDHQPSKYNKSYKIDKDNFCKIDFKKNEKNFPLFPKSYKVVFSSNPQSENNSKKSINGFAYIFYKQFNEHKYHDKKKYTYYIPYTFCIISEFPYFNSFNKLCKNIKRIYIQKAIYIPIEILIHNIVTLSPSPINSDVIIDLNSSVNQFNSFGNFNNAISSITTSEIKQNKETNKENSPKKSFNPKHDSKPIRNSQVPLKKRFSYVDDSNINDTNKKQPNSRITSSGKDLLLNINKENRPGVIKFKFLSGYPLIQYNLAEVLLHNLNPEKVIIIFLFTFLEKDVIFFSKDIEYLTLTLNAYLNLNFPLNDEKYYFIGTAISFEDFSNGNGEFGLKNYTSIIGINDQFRSDYKNKNLKIGDHLVIDLDRGEIYQGFDEGNSNVNDKNKKIIKLIKRLCETSEEDKIKKITLYHAIKNLSERLKNLYANIHDSKKIPEKFMDFNGEDIQYHSIKSNINSGFYRTINEKNREIQEAFYEFVHNVCLYFYENLSIKAQEDEGYKNSKKTGKSDREQNMNIIFNKDYQKLHDFTYTEEELIFLDELTDTMKFQSFVFGFLQSYNPIDLYKIPLTFTEEFLSIISRKKEQLSKKNISFFSLIDSLYYSGKKNEEKKVNFDLINFNYFKKYKAYFDREIQDKEIVKYYPNNRNLIKYLNSKTKKEHEKNENDNIQKNLMYQTYELDDDILLKYLHFTKNLNAKEYLGAFYGSFYIEENILKNINLNEIETKIENYCINNKILSTSDICCANIILLFTLSLKSLRETVDCQTFLGILFQDFTVFRKYYSVLLRMIYRLYKDPINKKNYTSTLCYYPCINSIRLKKLVPNEDLLIMINHFNKINIGEELNLQEEVKEEDKKTEKNNDVKLYGEDLNEIPITPENLYVYHNFTQERFVKEKEIVKSVNKYMFSEQVEINLIRGGKITPKIRFNNGIHKIESFFISQKILLDSLFNEFNKYVDDLDDNKLNSKIILDACLNIFIFMRNNDEFLGKDDIFEVLQCIFYIFMNQLFILKKAKEKEVAGKM